MCALESGADGVGLYRTEILYMGRDTMPSEDEQFEVYKRVAESMNPRPVVMRTLDIGGDKKLNYLDIPKEDNLFINFHRGTKDRRKGHELRALKKNLTPKEYAISGQL